MSEEVPSALPHLLTAAGAGGAGRILLALHGGERRWPALILEACLGGLLGVIAAAAAVYYDPDLRNVGFGLFVVCGVAGCAGAIGIRVLDLVTLSLQRRLGL
jgi:peptidoglycan/LPS O-acetylase OafA/YrhL